MARIAKTASTTERRRITVGGRGHPRGVTFGRRTRPRPSLPARGGGTGGRSGPARPVPELGWASTLRGKSLYGSSPFSLGQDAVRFPDRPTPNLWVPEAGSLGWLKQSCFPIRGGIPLEPNSICRWNQGENTQNIYPIFELASPFSPLIFSQRWARLQIPKACQSLPRPGGTVGHTLKNGILQTPPHNKG